MIVNNISVPSEAASVSLSVPQSPLSGSSNFTYNITSINNNKRHHIACNSFSDSNGHAGSWVDIIRFSSYGRPCLYHMSVLLLPTIRPALVCRAPFIVFSWPKPPPPPIPNSGNKLAHPTGPVFPSVNLNHQYISLL